NAAIAVILELDGEISRIRLGYRKHSKLQACPARRAFDFRNVPKNPFDMVENTIRFLKRTPGRHHVIENESALIEGGKEPGSELSVRKVRDTDQQHTKDAQR